MRILAIGEECDLSAMYDRLADAGHEVRVHVENHQFRELIRGGVGVSNDWKNELGWLRDAGDDGLVLFESARHGELQDELRRGGYLVFGGCAYGDRLEADREFGQSQLRQAGVRTAQTLHFEDYQAAVAFIENTPGRYVFKNNGAASVRSENFVGQAGDGSDMIGYLKAYGQTRENDTAPNFILMQFIEGIEVGVGAYFNGERFLETVCIDWEHKRFFPGDLGELTGEMGTIVSYRGATPIFNATLARMAEPLRVHGYVGYINLNLIANGEGLWPLEFTCRFGYPGYAICSALHEVGWAEVFKRILRRLQANFPTRSGFAAGIVLTVPPFPYPYGYEKLSRGSRISFSTGLNTEDLRNIHLGEVAEIEGGLAAAGETGCLGVATGAGETVAAARELALRRARGFIVPNLRYRTDIGEKLIQGELEVLRSWDYWCQGS